MLLPTLAATQAASAILLVGTMIPVASCTSSFITLASGNTYERWKMLQSLTQSMPKPIPSSFRSSLPLPSSIGSTISNTKTSGTITSLFVAGDPDQTTTSGRSIHWDSQTASYSTVIVTSRQTEIVPRTNRPSSTLKLAPTTTPYAISESRFASQASSVSSGLSGLDRVLASWKSNSSGLQSDTLGKINYIENKIWSLVLEAGGSNSSVCDSTGEPLELLKGGVIYDGTESFLCILEVLDELHFVVEHGITHDVDGLLKTLTSSKNNRRAEVNSRRDNDNHYNGSQTSALSSSSISSLKSSGTTTSRMSSNSSLPPVCAFGSCGDHCDDQPLSSATPVPLPMRQVFGRAEETRLPSWRTAATPSQGNFTLLDTVSSYRDTAALGVDLVDEPDDEDKPKDGNAPDGKPLTLDEKDFLFLIKWMGPGGWIPKNSWTTGKYISLSRNVGFEYGSAFGVNGLYGCTAVFIMSTEGAYVSHIFEAPVFVTEDTHEPTTLTEFALSSYMTLLYGNRDAESIIALVGTDETPGPLNAIYNPEIFIITPYRVRKGIKRPGEKFKVFLYETRARLIGSNLAKALGDPSGRYTLLGYLPTEWKKARSEESVNGKAILTLHPQGWDGWSWNLLLEGKDVAKSTDC